MIFICLKTFHKLLLRNSKQNRMLYNYFKCLYLNYIKFIDQYFLILVIQ
jgi:hypothetical protein